jgi:hypothetical protein
MAIRIFAAATILFGVTMIAHGASPTARPRASMFKATTMTGNGHTVEALPIEKTVEVLKAHRIIR